MSRRFAPDPHLDLVVPWVSVHKRQQLMPRCGIYQPVDPWQGKAILRVSLVQVGEVYAHSSLSIIFFYQNYIGQPIRIGTSRIKSTFNSLVTSLPSGMASGIHGSLLLSHRLRAWVNVDSMHDNQGVYVGHVLVGPSEYVSVFLKKLDEVLLRST